MFAHNDRFDACMESTKQLLVVHHSQSGSTDKMAAAVIAGATDALIDGVTLVSERALNATAEQVLSADGIILGTPENFGYMSGAMKHFFDSIYYPCLEHTQGMPYGLFIRAGNDGRGAVTSIERIVTGLAWKRVAPPIILSGEFLADGLNQCRELGMAMAAGLEAGVF